MVKIMTNLEKALELLQDVELLIQDCDCDVKEELCVLMQSVEVSIEMENENE